MPVNAPEVSVLLPVFNGERFLREQLDSILNQSHRAVRVLAIDDASTDGSLDVLREVAATDRRLRVERNARNLGLIATIGRLLQTVDTPYFALSDQDDIWDVDKVARSLEHLQSAGAALVYSDVRVCDERGRPTDSSYLNSRGIAPLEGRDPVPFIFRNPAIGHTMVGTRSVAVAARDIPIELSYHEAWIVGAACTLGRVSFVPDQLGSYRVHGANVVGPRRVGVWPRVRHLLKSRSHLRKRQTTRERALRALAELHPRLRPAARRYTVRGFRRVVVFPMVVAFLVRQRRAIGLRPALLEVVLFAGDSFGRRTHTSNSMNHHAVDADGTA